MTNEEIYKIPERDIVHKCLEKAEEEILTSRTHGSKIYFNPICCKLISSSKDLRDLCKTHDIDPNSFGSYGGVHTSFGNLKLNTQIGSLIGDLGGIVGFINDFIFHKANKVDPIARRLTKEQYEKINGRKWKDWSWFTFLSGGMYLPTYIHKTGYGVNHHWTTEGDIQEEIRNARTKGKKALREIFFGPSTESIKVEEEGKKLISYANQIDDVIGKYIHYGNLKPRR
ncbi:MAG: hypothetical protein ABIJ14_03030 [Nanoarchaeota archaeon]|nr:hypothetical protein [Nanoarchaeota archaeon]